MLENSSAHAIVTPGEAPETDDELDDVPHKQKYYSTPKDTSLVSEGCSKVQKPVPRQFDPQAKPLYDNALHRKLREVNVQMDRDLQEFMNKEGATVSKDIHSLAAASNTTQEILQDSWVNIRKVADTLYQVDANIDSIVASVHVWPDFRNQSK